jgi:outer membrane protein
LKTIKSYLLAGVIIAIFAVPSFAQKFAFVHSQKILAEYQEYKDVQTKLNDIRNAYDSEYQLMVKEYQDLYSEIESQSLLLSEEKKQEKMKQLQQKQMEIEKFKYDKLGPEGELYQKSMEFSKPILDKINKLIAKIGEEEGYDFVFDAGTGALVYALPKYDITDRVLEELNKGQKTTKKGSK